MASLFYPSSETQKYFVAYGSMFGPLGAGYNMALQEMSFAGYKTYFKQKKGIFHENEVRHISIGGDIIYHPVMEWSIPNPSATYPRRLKIPIKESPFTLSADYGLAVHQGSSASFSSTINRHYIYEYESQTGIWTFIEVNAYASSPTTVSSCTFRRFYATESYPTGKVKVYYEFAYPKKLKPVGSPTIDWTKVQSYQTIKSYTDGFEWGKKSDGTWYTATVTCNLYSANPQAIRNPQWCIDGISQLIYSLLPGYFPIKEVHYGDLAAKAAEKKVACSVNMLEFLRDVRHIKEIVPKLRNLRNLKGVAGEYLKLNYGILPTISDIQDIIAAFKKRRYGTDRYGNTVYRAGHSDLVSSEQLDFTLDQKIKLAIANEDDDFQLLLEKVDNVGLLPTFENLWDLVRYSFVIDWFVNIGDFLARVDDRLRLTRYNIQYATLSRKKTMSGYSAGSATYPFVGSIVWEDYHRWAQRSCPLPPLTLQFNPLPTSHWLDGAALLIQRT